ncbi:MAG: hypothetical protein A2V52_07685 [Actinobacteria bacterium RBG_19FT_COMBO_54_7]|uniref:DUF3144 domain-containing protein n=1 Tax=Candidatus Solincola sediminis TaxID=1797199 RepID=A0A1F2WKB7_9ACTN|nr:MAG: hypothetical protein A2Y75_07520 [Candidatus Solincola sediminis]OFW58830.1 MAG: hypothetical protein A2W01_01805 [Candidatus Solincola sediminis]OFW66496.1 MAG: hypothetical protein A2V52_07685 [Actinobacteria bacterium RBG_19FT_COMBO_54_7]
MPDGFLAKTQAEVALDLVTNYLQFAGEAESTRYRDAGAYLDLYAKAYRLILEIADMDKEKPQTGFKP